MIRRHVVDVSINRTSVMPNWTPGPMLAPVQLSQEIYELLLQELHPVETIVRDVSGILTLLVPLKVSVPGAQLQYVPVVICPEGEMCDDPPKAS